MNKKNLSEFFIEKGLLLTAMFSIITILVILGFIFIEGLPAFQENGFIQFLLGMDWSPSDGNYGVFPMIIGTLCVTIISLIIAVPLSVLCAIFMAEVADEKIKNFLKPVIQTLSGIPSVVYGFFGLIVLVPLVRHYFGGTGFSILTAGIILAVMILPTIISVSFDALSGVPHEYKEASLGLGATSWQTISKVIFPAALPGIVTAVILGMGRAVGETLAVIMVAGNVAEIPHSIFDPVRTLTSNIALEMNYATGIHYNSLFATAVILFFIIVLLLVIANYIKRKYKMDIGGGSL
ncbi:phosphate ABC transporter permease subunit PstC [Methanobrevibacter sp.]|uniref:phosphate ABC transporter permease subunit PstC n=1 Tax=Methanobrevibacter sp. TaxID=66852 RepID=UPI0026E05FEC|nr:phosphate ABC transporter permease subunit PstC [Methanobrevibacter sp.]MDO5823255.1 phosphate ABC transporter permease subunit PstC [Methanobrevibacter sp.]